MTNLYSALFLIENNEGFRSKPYKDSRGNLTIGYGFNLDAGIGTKLAEQILIFEIEDILNFLDSFSWFLKMNDFRQAAILDVCYNVGTTGFMKFLETINALEAGNYSLAAACLLDSDAARELPSRYARDADILRSGVIPNG